MALRNSILLLLFFSLTSLASEISIEAKHRFITDKNRWQNGAMFGGWGQHLGRLLRANDGSLWFVHDTGNDANKNFAILYHRLGSNAWQEKGNNTLPGRVQQNVSSVIDSNGKIWSYGIDKGAGKSAQLVECFFDTNTSQKGCSYLPFQLPALSNYIGAALTPSGYKIVWWTTVGAKKSRAELSYVYNFGGGWNGPTRTPLTGGYIDASYIHIAFNDDQSFSMVAELVSGTAGVSSTWKFHAAVTDGVIGEQLGSWQMLAGWVGQDIWIDPHGGTHVLTSSGKNNWLEYYYRYPNGTWNHAGQIKSIVGAGRLIANKNNLCLVYSAWENGSSEKGAHVKTIPIADIHGPINWNTIPRHHLPLIPGYEAIPAFWPEGDEYQMAPVKNCNVTFVGPYQKKDAEVWHYDIKAKEVNP